MPAKKKTQEVAVSPAAEVLAAEHGVNLSKVEGTGHEGRVSLADVQAALADDGQDDG